MDCEIAPIASITPAPHHGPARVGLAYRWQEDVLAGRCAGRKMCWQKDETRVEGSIVAGVSWRLVDGTKLITERNRVQL